MTGVTMAAEEGRRKWQMGIRESERGGQEGSRERGKGFLKKGGSGGEAGGAAAPEVLHWLRRRSSSGGRYGKGFRVSGETSEQRGREVEVLCALRFWRECDFNLIKYCIVEYN